MQFKKPFWVMVAVILTLSLSSCNIGKSAAPTQDVNAIYTAAAGTMLAQFGDQMTQTAQAVTPTPADSPTPLATFTSLPTFSIPGTTPFAVGTQFVFNTPSGAGTPLPTLSTGGTGATPSTAVGCADSAFVSETIPDGTIFPPGKAFTKSWNLQNTGTCTWDDGFSFVFVSGNQMGGKDILITKSSDFTKPGAGQAFNVPMKAPTTPGTYQGNWQMKDDQGHLFGVQVWVKIVVQ
jgi:hypothetical protein